MSVGAPAGATTAWPQGKCVAYAPAASDVALGRALLEQWLTFFDASFPTAGVGCPPSTATPVAAALRPRRHRQAGATTGSSI